MTATAIPLHPAPVEPSKSKKLYRAWRYAQAQYRLADYDPRGEEFLSDEEGDAFCKRTSEALNAYLLCPAETIGDFARKLRIFQEEDIMDGWCLAPAILASLVKDAHDLAMKEF